MVQLHCPSPMTNYGNIHKDDIKYLPTKPDPLFNAARNKHIVLDAIRKNDLMRARKEKEYADKIGERAEAIASFLTSRHGAAYSKATDDRILQYFGKRELARLRGQDIAEMLRARKQVIAGMFSPSTIPSIYTPDGKRRKVYDVQKAQKRKKKV